MIVYCDPIVELQSMESEEHQRHNQLVNEHEEMFSDDRCTIKSNQNEITQDQQQFDSISVQTDIDAVSLPDDQRKYNSPAKVMIIEDEDNIHQFPVKSPEEEDPYTYIAVIGECSCTSYCV